MRQSWNQVEMNVYHLQPDDGPRYVFGLVDLDRFCGDPTDFFPGAGHSYVLLVPFLPQGQPYPFDKHALLSPYRALVWYAQEKMEMHRHTCAALILAAGSLVQFPDALHLAGQRMLLAQRLLDGLDVDWALHERAEAHRIREEETVHAAL
jgi:hypothetical protein